MWCSNVIRPSTLLNLTYAHFCPLPHARQARATVNWKLSNVLVRKQKKCPFNN